MRASCKYKVPGGLDGALEDYSKALEEDPENARALREYGICCHDARKEQDAMRFLNEALLLNPKDAVAINARGVVKEVLGHFAASEEDYASAIRLNPKWGRPYCNRGRLRLLVGEHRLALEDFDSAERQLNSEHSACVIGLLFSPIG